MTLWSSTLGLLTSPPYYWALPDDGSGLALFDDPAAGYAALRMLIGLGLLPVAAILTRALAQGTAGLARAVLGSRWPRETSCTLTSDRSIPERAPHRGR